MRLGFIRAARSIGLSLGEIREILAVRDRGQTPCAHVARLIERHAADLAERIAALERMRQDLERLARTARTVPPEQLEQAAYCHLIETSAQPSRAPVPHPTPSEASLGPPSSRTAVIGKPQRRSAIRASSIRDPRSVRPTAAVRCAEVRSASRPAGHSESGWSDEVSADVERTPDTTSPPRTCHKRQDPGNQGALRRGRDFARQRWPLRGSSGHLSAAVLRFVDGRDGRVQRAVSGFADWQL
jgi:MerR, DNA binding